MSQKIQLALTVCITIITGMLLFSALRPQAPILQEITIKQPEERTIQTYGIGDTKCTLDTAKFDLVIESDGPELGDVKLENEKSMQQATKILQDHAVEVKDINIGFQHILYKNRFLTDPLVFSYAVKRTLGVIMHGLAGLHPLFTDLQDAGFSKISNIAISDEDINLCSEKALQQAMINAEAKAKAMALGIDREIGQIIEVSELSTETTSFFYTDLYSFYGENSENRWQSKLFSSSEITISMKVSVTFELK